MADNLVRLGLAFTAIVLITASLYAVNAPRRALTIEPSGLSLTK